MIPLIFPILVLMLSMPEQAIAIDPNRVQVPTPGWGAWQPNSEVKRADFDAGFSNIELGGFLDFQAACAKDTGLPMDAFPNWFRLSDLINQIGTGEVEYGCWANGRFLHTYTIAAIKSSLGNVNCLRVNPMNGTSLVVYAEPNANSKQIRTLRNGTTVNPGSFPAWIVQTEGQNWVEIQSPVEGWVLQGTPGSRGNLSLCRR